MSHQPDGNNGYKKIRHLGQGSFGKVYLVQGTDDELLYVIKQFNMNEMDEKQINNALTEIQVLKTMNHPNITRFKEVYKTKKGKLCIVMEYADGGDLSMAIRTQNGKYFLEEQILDWFTQICLALRYVHDLKILHRDLKSQNIFLTKGNVVKLGDFGIACILSQTRDHAKTMAGTPFNLSPEIIDGNEYSYKSDIWSLGIVLYELCALVPPFVANGFSHLAIKIIKGQYAPIPNHYSKDLHNLVSMLLKTNPLQRPTVAEILSLPLIKQRIIEPWGITKTMCLSPHQKDEKYQISTRSTWEQSGSQKAFELNYNHKIPNSNSISPKSVLPNLSKRQSHPPNDLAPTNNLMPSLNHLSVVNSHTHQTDLSNPSNTKQSSFLEEEDFSQNSHQLSKNRKLSPCEEKDSPEWTSFQEIQKTIKKNIERAHFRSYKIESSIYSGESGNKPTKFATPPKYQHSLEPIHQDHVNKNSIFKKIAEHDLVSISAGVSPGRSMGMDAKKNRQKEKILNTNSNLYSISEDLIVNKNLSNSPEKIRKNKLRQEVPHQRQDYNPKIKEESMNQEIKSFVEPKREIERIRIKKQKNLGESKRNSKPEIEQKESFKINKANSLETETLVRSPPSLSNPPILEMEQKFPEDSYLKEDSENLSRFQRTGQENKS